MKRLEQGRGLEKSGDPFDLQKSRVIEKTFDRLGTFE